MTSTVAARVVVEGGRVARAEGWSGDVPWWSIAKTVIAASALALVRDGRLALDGPVAGRPFSLRQLLLHRGGVGDYGGLAAYHDAVARGEGAWPADELLSRSGADRPVAPPGTGFLYSNIGYLFVVRLVEEASGQPLGAALGHLVLGPLGITGARLAVRREDLAAVAMGAAHGYDPRWVYHGLLVGPLQDAALLLHRLVTTDLLPRDLKMAMLAAGTRSAARCPAGHG